MLDLRTFARVEEAEFKLVDLAATLRGLSGSVGIAVVVGVNVAVELAEMAPFECAPARLNQAVLNLFTNAVRAASPTGMVRVGLPRWTAARSWRWRTAERVCLQPFAKRSFKNSSRRTPRATGWASGCTWPARRLGRTAVS